MANIQTNSLPSCPGCGHRCCLNVKLLKVQDVPWVIPHVAAMLSAQWGRAVSERTVNVSKSSDKLPLFIALVLCDGTSVAGCYSLSHVVSCATTLPKPVGLENVLVEPRWQGCGYGRLLVNHAEITAASMNFDSIHLNTLNKHDFYAHLGFENHAPVIITASSSLTTNSALKVILERTAPSVSVPEMSNSATIEDCNCKPPVNAPPPPPPPKNTIKLAWMRKLLK